MAIATKAGRRARARGGTTRATNGSRRTGDRPVAPPARRVRLPELGIGLLIVLVFALGGVLWHLRSVDRSPSLAVASAIQRGDVIDSDDLRVVYVSSDDRLARLAPEQSDRVIGMTALVDLAPGALVTEDVVSEGATVGDDEGVVGLSLEPGQYPAFDLAPGDLVNVVQMGATASDDASASDREPRESEDERAGNDEAQADGAEEDVSSGLAVATGVEVTAVEDLAGGERKLVSLLAGVEEADGIATLDPTTLRLVLVAP